MIDLIYTFIKMFFVNICICYIYNKITNYKESSYIKIICIFIFSILSAIIYTCLQSHLNLIFNHLFNCFLLSICMSNMSRKSISYSMMIILISLAISYIGIVCATVISFILLELVQTSITNIEGNYLAGGLLIFIGIVQFILVHFFFKMKRLKNGFSFLQNSEGLNNIFMCGLIFFINILLICDLFRVYNQSNEFNNTLRTYLLSCILLIILSIIIWVYRELRSYYRYKIMLRDIQNQEETMNELKEKNDKITEENLRLTKIIHKYNIRISALERATNQITNLPKQIRNSKEEFGILELEKDIQGISKELSYELLENIGHDTKLPLTNIFGIDNMFQYMAKKAKENNIDFTLRINHSIQYLIEKIISKQKLETIIGDHIKDAIIAINSSNNINKSIIVTLGIVDECYELRIYDSGVEFQIDTLLDLGIKQNTTYKEKGGSGIGFITTFEALKECGGTVIIKEKKSPSKEDYTKAVIFRFDGKNQYRIQTYRAKQIKKKLKNNRIKIEEL